MSFIRDNSTVCFTDWYTILIQSCSECILTGNELLLEDVQQLSVVPVVCSVGDGVQLDDGSWPRRRLLRHDLDPIV